MPDRTIPLEAAERASLVASLTTIRDTLDGAGELLGAAHVSHAIEVITAGPSIENPIVHSPG